MSLLAVSIAWVTVWMECTGTGLPVATGSTSPPRGVPLIGSEDPQVTLAGASRGFGRCCQKRDVISDVAVSDSTLMGPAQCRVCKGRDQTSCKSRTLHPGPVPAEYRWLRKTKTKSKGAMMRQKCQASVQWETSGISPASRDAPFGISVIRAVNLHGKITHGTIAAVLHGQALGQVHIDSGLWGWNPIRGRLKGWMCVHNPGWCHMSGSLAPYCVEGDTDTGTSTCLINRVIWVLCDALDAQH